MAQSGSIIRLPAVIGHRRGFLLSSFYTTHRGIQSLRAGYVQNSPILGQVQHNLDDVWRQLGDERFELLVLPELFSSGYFFGSRDALRLCAEEAGHGPVSNFMIKLAGRIKGHVVGGFAELDGDRIYNSAALVGPEGIRRVYRKIHLFDGEKLLFDQAEGPFWVEDIGQCRVGVMVCFDWYFPEAARTLALKGADIIAHPSNLVLPHCPEAMKTRALENRVFTITANRVGSDRQGHRSLSFIGRSVMYHTFRIVRLCQLRNF